MILLNKSYKNRKVSLTIHCKYKYLDSTVQRAEDRRQKFAVCRLPFAVNVKLNLSNVLRASIQFGMHADSWGEHEVALRALPTIQVHLELDARHCPLLL